MHFQNECYTFIMSIVAKISCKVFWCFGTLRYLFNLRHFSLKMFHNNILLSYNRGIYISEHVIMHYLNIKQVKLIFTLNHKIIKKINSNEYPVIVCMSLIEYHVWTAISEQWFCSFWIWMDVYVSKYISMNTFICSW